MARPSTTTRKLLTREDVVAAAIRRLDAEGLAGLSMRRLASELGVGTMTLYGYFPDKDALLDAVVDTLSDAIPIPETQGDWETRLRALLHHFHRGLLEHPSLVELRFARPIATPAAFRLTEACLQALREAGLDRPRAAAVFRTLFIFTFGAAAFAARADERGTAQVGAVLAGLPQDEYPELTGSVPEALALMDPQRSFEAGLDALLAGVRS